MSCNFPSGGIGRQRSFEVTIQSHFEEMGLNKDFAQVCVSYGWKHY